ncbi:Hca operon transcriptional activator HcaR [Streptomyces sp. enrichment culture]|uniref:LysR family transcriptional regulator n=1 Tax=Streptomyces sp. enrichment culture TaxID=1795815 RepID=UPI003F56F733
MVGTGSGRPTEPSIHQLRLFLVLAEELHFGRAATRLFITQSALSQQIRDMERRLGVRLFERTSRSVVLTAAGQALRAEARTAVGATDRMRRIADAQARRLSGRLVVGTIGAEAAMPHTRAVLRTLRDRHPGVIPEVRSFNFVDHIAALVRQEADVTFLRPPVPACIEVHHLAEEPRVACLPADDPLSALPRLTLAQLADRTVADVPEQVPRVWWDFWAVDPRPDGSPVRYGPVATDMESLLHIVASGAAMCFLPAAARDFFPRPDIRYVDVTGLAPSVSALAWLAERRAEPTIAAIRQVASAQPRCQPAELTSPQR